MREDQQPDSGSDPFTYQPTGGGSNFLGDSPTTPGLSNPPVINSPSPKITNSNPGPPQPLPQPYTLPEGASWGPNGVINWAPGTATLAKIQQTPGTTPSGGTTTLGQGTGSFANPQTQQQTQQQGQLNNPNNIDLTGIDPRLTAFFQQHNLTPTGRGTGNTDIAYWNDKLQEPGADWGYFQGRILGVPGLGDSGAQPSITAGQGSQFADPSYQALSALAQQYSSAFQQQAQQRSAEFQKLQDMLAQNQMAVKQRAQTFADQLGQRVNQLQNTPLYSDQQTAAIRQQASGQLQAARDQAIRNAQQQTYARGFAPTSGVLNDQLTNINRDSSNAQSNIDAQLLASAGQANEQRLNEATNLQGLAQQALQGGDITGLQEQAQAVNAQYQQQQIQRQQMMDALSTAGIPVSLTNSGVNTALQTLGSGGSPNSTLASMMSLLALGNQQQGMQQTNQNNTMQGIGQLLAMLMNGFGG